MDILKSYLYDRYRDPNFPAKLDRVLSQAQLASVQDIAEHRDLGSLGLNDSETRSVGAAVDRLHGKCLLERGLFLPHSSEIDLVCGLWDLVYLSAGSICVH